MVGCAFISSSRIKQCRQAVRQAGWHQHHILLALINPSESIWASVDAVRLQCGWKRVFFKREHEWVDKCLSIRIPFPFFLRKQHWKEHDTQQTQHFNIIQRRGMASWGEGESKQQRLQHVAICMQHALLLFLWSTTAASNSVSVRPLVWGVEC